MRKVGHITHPYSVSSLDDAEIIDKIKQYKYGIKTIEPDPNGLALYLDHCIEQLPIYERELRKRKLEKLKYGDS
jgi:hypothetical protein